MKTKSIVAVTLLASMLGGCGTNHKAEHKLPPKLCKKLKVVVDSEALALSAYQAFGDPTILIQVKRATKLYKKDC